MKATTRSALTRKLKVLEEDEEGKPFHDIMSVYSLSASQVRNAWQWVHRGKEAVYADGVSGSSTDRAPFVLVDKALRTEEDDWSGGGVNLLDSCPPNVFRMRNQDSGSGTNTGCTDTVRDLCENLGIRPSTRASNSADFQRANQVSS